MKKLLTRLILVAVLGIIVALVCVGIFIDSIVEKGVETVGPKVAQVPITIDGASVSMLGGSGTIKALQVGNPEGFKTPSAIKASEISVSVDPLSVLKKKVVVRSVKVTGPEITFEGSLKGSNLSKILENVQSFAAGEKSTGGSTGSGKKLQVDELLIQDGKVNLSLTMMGGKSATVPLPTIHLKDLGRDAEGITPAEFASKVMKALMENTTSVVGDAIGKLGKEATEAVKDLGEGAKSQLDKVSKGLGGLLKR